MNAYHLAALPPALLLIAVPELWPWALALVAFVVIAALLESRRRLHVQVARLRLALEQERNRRARQNHAAVVEIRRNLRAVPSLLDEQAETWTDGA